MHKMQAGNHITRRGFFYSLAIGFVGSRFALIKNLSMRAISPFSWSFGLGAFGYPSVSAQTTSRSAPTPGISVKRFTTPGKQYSAAADKLREELHSHYKGKTPYPISRIFALFPFQVADEKKKQALIKRGSIQFDKAVASNRGEKLEVQFYDEFLKKIIVVFPDFVQANLEILPDNALRLEFEPDHTGLVVLYMLDPNHEIAPNQLLESITFSQKNISYLLHQENKENQKVRIIVDLTMAPPATA